MDFATLGGLIIGLGLMAVGAVLEHIKLGSLLGISAFLIVVGGSMGATVMSHTTEDLKNLGAATKLALMKPKLDWAMTIDLLVELAEKARRGGLLSLQADAEGATNPFMKRGLSMAVDGADPDRILSVLNKMNEHEAEEMTHSAMIWDTAGGYCPTLGILGTVMGLVTIMGNLSEPETLGPAIAVAFLATLYGVFFANMFFLPLGAKIKLVINQKKLFNEMIIVGLIGLQSGENPRSLREKLEIHAGHFLHGGKPAKAGKEE
ncbi:MAG TPA: MotA/TolQ/ExbB proton channel family protein, partial [Symbiobacteriaceae bacterium]|nr:MotA/TolQ/ExbB proton channel family protein [Symbiobacteriaceae bacterium]